MRVLIINALAVLLTSSVYALDAQQPYRCHGLPDDRVACAAPPQSEGQFRCSMYGNFSRAEFAALFVTKDSFAVLRKNPGEFKVFSEETVVVRPCLEQHDEDSAPPRCLKYDDDRYAFIRRLMVVNLTASVRLFLECDNYLLGRVRL